MHKIASERWRVPWSRAVWIAEHPFAAVRRRLIGLSSRFAAIAGLAAFVLPATLAYFYVINLFYVHGAYSWDAGWFAELIGRPSLTLPVSPSIDPNHWGSWYAYHISPFLAVVSWIGALLPFGGPQLLAILLGAFTGALGLTLFAALESSCEGRPTLRVIAFPMAILASFSGPALATISFPHFEGAIPIFALAFITCRALGYRRLAFAAFVACLLLREDAGLHLALLLGSIAVAEALQSRSLRPARREAPFILAAIGYAVAASLIHWIWFPHDQLLRAEFIGMPLFAHLFVGHLMDVGAYFIRNRAYIYLPFLVTLGAALWTRSWILLAGFASSIPWLIVSLGAVSDQVTKMIAYYAFPFIVGCCWPAVAALLERNSARLPPWKTIAIQLAVTAVSIIGYPGNRHMVDDRPWTWFHPLPHAISVRHTDAVVRWIGDNKPNLGRIIAGDGIVALAPSLFDETEWYKWNDAWPADRFASVDTLVAFKGDRLSDRLADFIAVNPDVSILEGWRTDIVVATRKPFSEAAFPPDLIAHPCIEAPGEIAPRADVKPNDAAQFSAWSLPEKAGRWTVGASSVLLLQLCHVPANGVRLVIDAHAFVTNGHPDDDVALLANGVPVADWHFRLGGGDRIAPVPVSAEILDHKPNLRLVFRIANPASPAELGMSSDDRALGLFLEKLTIEENAK